MTNAPTSRKTHVIRILGTNRSGDVLSHIWVDVERIDRMKFATQLIDNDWQGHQRKFRWMDDPFGDDYEPEGNPARKHFIVKICDPNSNDVDDPDEWVPIKVIMWMHSRGGGGSLDGLGTMHRYRVDPDISDPSVTTRVTEVRKIPHYDTSIDDAAQAAFDSDPSLPAYVVPGDQYVKDLSTKDDTQFVDHEIVTSLKKRTNETSVNNKIGGVDRGRQTRLLNQYLIDESDKADGQVIGASGINPPYRLDPYQSIINVQFSLDVIVMFIDLGGEIGAPSRFIPNSDKHVKFLTSFHAIQPDTAPPGFLCTAYQVNSNAGEFLSSIYPGVSEGTFKNKVSMTVAIFAMDGKGIASSLERAVTGTKKIVAETSTSAPVPNGALWIIGAVVGAGKITHWKIRLGKHRNDNFLDPPNSMVQCYQSDGTFSTPEGPVTGYTISGYRLDRRGSGKIYGEIADITDPSSQSIDPIWHQTIFLASVTGVKGIPFADPPPLINIDR